MIWKSKFVESFEDFKKLEIFFKKNYSDIYNFRLSADYLFEKIHGNGAFLVAIDNNSNVLGTISLTFKEALIDKNKNLIAEIGDSYVPISNQRKFKNIDYLYGENKFINNSIFGRLVHEIVEYSKQRKIKFIYGTANNQSYRGYTKNLNFSDFEDLNLYSYILPDKKILEAKTNNFFAIIFYKFFDLYLKIISKFFYNNIFVQEEKNPQKEIIESLWLEHQKKYDFTLKKNFDYFKKKYFNKVDRKFNYYFVYKKKKIIAFFVLDLNLDKNKVFLIDNLFTKLINPKIEMILISKFYLEIKKSIIFWSKEFGLFKKILNIHKTKKINVILRKNENIELKFLKKDFSLSYSDNY